MAKKRGKAKIKANQAENSQKKVLKYFLKKPKHESLASEVIKALKKIGMSKTLTLLALDKLQESGNIVKLPNNKFILSANTKTSKTEIEGIVDMNKSNHAYVVTENLKKDIFINSRNINRALNGDKVKVELFLQQKGKSKIEGKIVEIIERNKTSFVGSLSIMNDLSFVITNRNKMNVDFFIPKNHLNGATDGDKVVVKLLEWRDRQKSPIGKIIEVIGKTGLDDVEMKTILIDNGFMLNFPDEAMNEANQLSDKITEEEIKRRKDLRSVFTITIDPDDAKDFDDAISLQTLNNGNYEIGIHIADVSHFVKEKSELDKEASKRATSVYLADRVLPMLPEVISNQLCSLRPNEEKCSFSAIFEIDSNGNIHKEWYGRTVILSDRRFTYNEAQELIESREGEYAEEVTVLNNIAKKLREKRYKKGSISFETTEVRFKFDDDGNPVSVHLKERKEAHLLVEDFMLLANKKVAEYIEKQEKKLNKKIPFVYRVHDLPDIEKLINLQQYAKDFGFDADLSNIDKLAENLNSLLKEVQGKPLQNLLSFLAIRTMAKAKYTTFNIGHFGLAFDHYTHFTSPIRRYPDVLAHRNLQNVLDGKINSKQDRLESTLEHCSKMERNAINAERTATKYMQVKFLSDKIGQHFIGMISGVRHYGIFVELVDNKCEGLIAIDSLPYDKYIYNEDKQEINGLLSKTVYRLGDMVDVTLSKTDLEKKTIDFVLVEE